VRAAGAPVPQIDPASGERFWIVARHRDVLEGLHHPDIGHEVRRHLPADRAPRPLSEVERIGARQLIDLDPPDHTRLRKLVNRSFTRARWRRSSRGSPRSSTGCWRRPGGAT
jgi:cytochrome P450